DAAVADLQHVRIVPVPDPRVGRQGRLDIDDARDVAPGRFDVRADAPHVRDARQVEPAGRGVRTGRNAGVPVVRVDAVDDRAAGGAQGVAHGGEPAERAAAIVVLEIVDAPGGVRLRVLLLVAEAAHVHGWHGGVAVQP